MKPHRLTVDELLSFSRRGALDGLPKMELLDGILYEMSPPTSAHVVAKNELGFRLRLAVEALDRTISVLIEPTLNIGGTSAPEPDVAILRQLRVDRYYPAHFVLLAVEVAVTTVETDLSYKRALYASAAIPEYWVIEVEAGRIHLFWSPEGEEYREAQIVSFAEVLSSKTIVGLSVETGGL